MQSELHDDPNSRLRRAIQAHGRDVVAFQGLEPGLRSWFDGECAVAYADTGTAWVAAGGPNAAPQERAAVAARFAAAAAEQGRRAAFFGVDDDARWEGVDAVLLGEEPIWNPAQWQEGLRGHRRLREQLRRARKKGVRVRRVDGALLERDAKLRAELDALVAYWLSTRSMEPMQFLVTLAPFHLLHDHRYFVAERDGRLCAFLAAVPIPARKGWLLEDLVRGPHAPNGTSEALIDAAMRDLASEGAAFATTGLAPLAGPVPRWMRAIGRAGSALFDFGGLERFKRRLHPASWQRVWLLHPRGQSAPLCVLDTLRAFAGGSLVGFFARTLARRPGAMAWALGAPLLVWAAALVVAAGAARASWLGFDPWTLLAWAAFDLLLALALLATSRRPTPWRLAALTLGAGFDAVASVLHLARVGPGEHLVTAFLRTVATAAPIVATVLLLRASLRARKAALR